jgi:hypothetical protein
MAERGEQDGRSSGEPHGGLAGAGRADRPGAAVGPPVAATKRRHSRWIWVSALLAIVAAGLGIWALTITDLAALRSPDRVNRDFTARRPDQLWVADFTYLRCWEGLVFFSFVIDVYSRQVVGWQLAGHMRTDLVLDALRMALSRRRAGADVELIHHSDAGSQIHQLCLQAGTRRPSRARLDRIGRRRLRQRPRRVVR